MKFSHIVPLAALSAAIVLPAEQVLSELAIEDHHSHGWAQKADSLKDDVVTDFEDFLENSREQAVSAKEDIISTFSGFVESSNEQVSNYWNHFADSSQTAVEAFFDRISSDAEEFEEHVQEAKSDFESWLDSEDSFELFEGPHHPPPPPPPHHPPPGHEPPHHPPPGHGPPEHRKPHHPKHPHKLNHTVYELIAHSKYTTKLAKLINEYPDIVKALNSTVANYTIFAPTDKAFEKIPEKAPKPSKDQLLAILEYHVLPGLYPAFRVLASHTAPTFLVGKHLGTEPRQQRVAFKLGLRGLTVNWFSRIVAVNIFGSNGVIHGIDTLLLPPPPALTIIDLLPGSFSTLELGLTKTGLYDQLNTTKHAGGTLFAPSNFAFEKLGPRVNAFLFSKYGQKYLKALLEYHVVPGNTLYSDAYYEASGSEVGQEGIPKGRFHVELPTLLKDRALQVDVARLGGLITIKINAFVTVAVQDIIAEDGVIHIVRSVLIPPKRLGGTEIAWDGEELTVEDLKERLEPFMDKSDL